MRSRKIIIYFLLIAVLLALLPYRAHASLHSDWICPSSARDIPILKIELVKSIASFIMNTLSIGLGPFGA